MTTTTDSPHAGPGASAFSSLVLERGAATLADLELSSANQVIFGGHLGTNLVELGVLKEDAFQRLLAEHYELPLGPPGRLANPTEEIEEVLPVDLAAPYRVFPVKRTRSSLQVATSRPLDAETKKTLADRAGMEILVVVVTPFRLSEALAAYAGAPIGDRERWLVEMLNAGRTPSRDSSREHARRRAERAFPVAAPYRRMSEHPDGIVPSNRQPPRRPTEAPPTPSPDTLDGVGPDTATDAPAKRLPRTLDPADPDNELLSEPPASIEDPGRITQPYADPVEVEDGEKRDTQPWRDDDVDDGPPVSVAGEFKASLSEAPPSDEAKIHEDHRRFRHRGPFTRPQAELAASQAQDVHMVLEILVRYARQFFERTVLFVVTGEHCELRISYGLSMSLSSLRIGLEEEPSVLREAHTSGDPVTRALTHDGVDAILRNKLSMTSNKKVAVVPLAIRERVVALFYGDDRNVGVDRDAVADVTDFIEICAGEITRLILIRKT